MGGRAFSVGLLLFLGVLTLTAEATRTHESFAAATYYPENEAAKDIEAEAKTETTDAEQLMDESNVTIPDRYPKGYPANSQAYYPQTAAQFTVEDNKEENINETATDPAGERYPHGYYPNSEYTKGNDLPSSTKQDHVSFNAVEDNNETQVNATIPDRYPTGYPTGTHNIGSTNPDPNHAGQYTSETVTNQQGVDPAGERYPHGYYPDSRYAGTTSQTKSYSAASTLSASQTVDPAGERYPHGYYPNSQYTQNFQSSSSSSSSSNRYNGVQFSAQTTNEHQTTEDPSGERYPHGYYPNSQYAQSQSQSQSGPMPVSQGVRYGSNTQGQSEPKPVNGVQFSAQTANEHQNSDPSGMRYPHGYYPNSQYAQSQSQSQSGPMPVSHGVRYGSNTQGQSQSGPKPESQGVAYSSYQGNFNTFPYGNNAGELPFDLTGAGCRSAYWVENVAKWPAFFNAKSTVEDAFGSKAKAVYGGTTILQGLVKYETDPYSVLLRSGCTAILNAYTRGAYSISHVQVIEEFNAALDSKDAAAVQALTFETANVQSISAGNACT